MPFFRISDRMHKTGQITQYGGENDDGFYEKGISDNMLLLNSGEYSGTTNITVNAKTDVHSNNCVLDRHSGLMYSNSPSASVGAASNGTLFWEDAVNGETIFAFANAANTALLSGYSDWRVVNIAEMVSIFSYEIPTAAPNVLLFSSMDSNNIFSSTTYPVTTTSAYVCSTYSGQVIAQSKTAFSSAKCLLVRGGV